MMSKQIMIATSREYGSGGHRIAEELAKNGAYFTCDCTNRSTRIPFIVKCAVEGKGKVVLKNCRWMSSVEISKLKTEGGNYIEIQ